MKRDKEKNPESEYSDILTKLPWESAKEEIESIFSPFALEVKEFEKENEKISFELHWKRLFLLRYKAESSGKVIVTNEYIMTLDGFLNFISFEGTCNNANMAIFIINFCLGYEVLPSTYSPEYREGVSPFYSKEEMANRLVILQRLLEKYQEEMLVK